MHRQHVEDVGPVVTVLVAVTHQAGGDRVAVGLVVDQHVSEVVAGPQVEGFEEGAEVGVLAHPDGGLAVLVGGPVGPTQEKNSSPAYWSLGCSQTSEIFSSRMWKIRTALSAQAFSPRSALAAVSTTPCWSLAKMS